MDFATIKGQGCAVCVSVCPFSQAGYDKIQGGFLLAQAIRLEKTQSQNRTGI